MKERHCGRGGWPSSRQGQPEPDAHFLLALPERIGAGEGVSPAESRVNVPNTRRVTCQQVNICAAAARPVCAAKMQLETKAANFCGGFHCCPADRPWGHPDPAPERRAPSRRVRKWSRPCRSGAGRSKAPEQSGAVSGCAPGLGPGLNSLYGSAFSATLVGLCPLTKH